MLRDIRKKMVILRNRSPFPQKVKDDLNNLEYQEWVYMNLHLSGSTLSREEMDTILRGGFIMQASVEDYLLIERLGQLRSFIYRLTDLGASLSIQIMKDMYAIIAGGSREDFRKGGVMMEKYGIYSPMIGTDIPEAMDGVVCFAGQSLQGENPFLKAAVLHNRIVEIYPFPYGNEMLARAVMYYVLAEAGYPMAALDLTEEEYIQMFQVYRREKDSRILAQVLEKAVWNRLDLMMQLTGYEN